MTDPKIAFIGGSGLYEMDGLTSMEELEVGTPFGDPSDVIVTGSINGTSVAFLPRHGRGHRLSPTEIPSRANIYSLKSLGVERIVSLSAVGSLKEEIRPLELLIPDQLLDRTRDRIDTFFGDGIVAHIGFAEPFCSALRNTIAQAARNQKVPTHFGGTYVTIEGPQFSTRSESELYRSWGASVIGMTALPEAKLAREAEICYATMALVTDYDCWHQVEEDVSVELVVRNLQKHIVNSRGVLEELVQLVSPSRDCHCESALEGAIITDPEQIAESSRSKLSFIVDKYLRVRKETY